MSNFLSFFSGLGRLGEDLAQAELARRQQEMEQMVNRVRIAGELLRSDPRIGAAARQQAFAAAFRWIQSNPQFAGVKLEQKLRLATVLATQQMLPADFGGGGVVGTLSIRDPQDPERPRILGRTRSGQLVDLETQEPWTGPVEPYERELAPKSGWMLDPESPTGYSGVQIDRKGQIVAKTPGLVPPAALLPQITQGQVTVVTDEGVFRIPTTTVRAPSIPGAPAPARVTPPAAPRKIGTRTPAMIRQRAEVASAILEHIKEARSEIRRLGKEGKLGVLAGRWNEFMAGKVGAGDPDYWRLRTNLAGLMASGTMMAHVGARGGQLLLEHFKSLMDTGKAEPELLLAAMDTLESWMRRYAEMSPTTEEGKAKGAQEGLSPEAQKYLEGLKGLGRKP